MNINLDYEGKHYNFDIPKNVKLDYLKELSCKLFKSDKTLLELICNNHKLEGNNENIFIRDLIPKGQKSTVLTVQMNSDNQKEKENNEIKENKKILNVTKNSKEIKVKNNEHIKENNSRNININNNLELNTVNNTNTNNNNDNQMYENRIFIAKYIKKSNELFAMMKDFNDKIKETDNNLNKKMKNFDLDCDNNIFYYELSLFEKRIIDFQKRQIKYYKELIQILSQNNDETKEPNFDIFYNKILLYNNDYSQDSIDVEKNKNKKNKILPNIQKINCKSVNNKIIGYDTDSLNSMLPLLTLLQL